MERQSAAPRAALLSWLASSFPARLGCCGLPASLLWPQSLSGQVLGGSVGRVSGNGGGRPGASGGASVLSPLVGEAP